MNKIIIPEQHFNPLHTFECGQCFRWDRLDDGRYRGIAHGRVIFVSYDGENIVIENSNKKDYEDIWKNYFDLGRDYGAVKNELMGDSVLKKAISYGGGIRILNQEFFECVISFIISANNNIPRIKGIIGKLSEMYGKKITAEGETFYSFPGVKELSGAEEGDLAPLRAGYRARYIAETVKMIERGDISEQEIRTLPLASARKKLCTLCGVGEKVADCILLFSLGRKDAFPTDVWVKRVMETLYGVNPKKAAEQGRKLFGKYAGIAQQYLFYYMREGEA